MHGCRLQLSQRVDRLWVGAERQRHEPLLLRHRQFREPQSRGALQLLEHCRGEAGHPAQVRAQGVIAGQIPLGQTPARPRSFGHLLGVQGRIRQPGDLGEFVQGQGAMRLPRRGPAGQQPVRDLLGAVVVEAQAAELQPDLPVRCLLLPAQPHRIGDTVERVEQGLVRQRNRLRLVEAGVEVGHNRHPGRLVQRL